MISSAMSLLEKLTQEKEACFQLSLWWEPNSTMPLQMTTPAEALVIA